VGDELTHIDGEGRASMVNVGDKPVTRRVARASALVRMAAGTAEAIKGSRLGKGEALAAARLAGILAAKRVDELIPLAHTLPVDHVSVDFEFIDEGLVARAEASATARTGVELEAMLAAAMAAMTIYDMAKAIDRGMLIERVQLEYKAGGRSGTWERE